MFDREKRFQVSRATYRWYNETRGRPLALRVERADTILARVRGWLTRTEPREDEGLWLTPCNGVHTFGMRYAIDIVVIDRDMRVVGLRKRLIPNRMMLPVRGGYATLEFAVGTIDRSGTECGDRLSWSRN